MESEIAKLKFSPSNLDITSRLRLFLPSRVRPIPCNAIYDVLTLIFFFQFLLCAKKKKGGFHIITCLLNIANFHLQPRKEKKRKFTFLSSEAIFAPAFIRFIPVILEIKLKRKANSEKEKNGGKKCGHSRLRV